MKKAPTKAELRAAAERCDDIAEAIKSIASGVRKLLDGQLNERAIVLLIYDACPPDSKGKKLGKTMINNVLDTIAVLDEMYLSAYDEEDDDNDA